MNEWISLKDNPPKNEGERYFIRNDENDVAAGWWNGGYFECWDDAYNSYSDTKYWMPIPELPERSEG